MNTVAFESVRHRKFTGMSHAENEGRDLHMLAMDSSLVGYAVAHAKIKPAIESFLAGGGKIDSVNTARESCIHVACRYGTDSVVKAYVMERVPVKLEAEGGWTALMYVARDSVARVGAIAALAMTQALVDGPAFEEPAGDPSLTRGV